MDIPSLDKDSDDYYLERPLLAFSNALGGFLTYVLIQAMNPANKITEGSKNSIEQDVMVQTWLEDVISLITPSVIRSFKYWVGSGLVFEDHVPLNVSASELFDKEGELFLKFLFERPYAIIEQRLISQLNQAFYKLFPNIHSKFEKIMCKLPKLIQRKEDHAEYMRYKIKQKTVCNHKYERLRNQNNILHCRKCHNTKKYFKFPRTNHEPRFDSSTSTYL